jgi:large subunit ribosomal protein L21
MMKYAIVESGGKQYKAVEGSLLEVDRLQLETGASLKIDQVLLVADGESIAVGTPVVKDTPIWTKVVEHFKGPKVVIFNYRPKKRIRVKTGHRQSYTRLLVEQIGGASLLPKKEPVKVLEAEVEKPAKKVKAEPKEQKPAEAGAKAEKKSSAAGKAASSRGKTAAQEKKPAAKGKAAATKPASKSKSAAKKPAAKKTTAKKPAGKSSKKD